MASWCRSLQPSGSADPQRRHLPIVTTGRGLFDRISAVSSKAVLGTSSTKIGARSRMPILLSTRCEAMFPGWVKAMKPDANSLAKNQPANALAASVARPLPTPPRAGNSRVRILRSRIAKFRRDRRSCRPRREAYIWSCRRAHAPRSNCAIVPQPCRDSMERCRRDIASSLPLNATAATGRRRLRPT